MVSSLKSELTIADKKHSFFVCYGYKKPKKTNKKRKKEKKMNNRVYMSKNDSVEDVIEKVFMKRFEQIENCENFEKQIEMFKDIDKTVYQMNWDFGITIRENPVLKAIDFYVNPDFYEDEELYIEYYDDIHKHAFFENHQFICFIEAEL